MATALDDDWAIFAEDAGNCIRSIEESLLNLEVRPLSAPDINSLYRGLHTLKGSSGFLSLQTFGKVAHVCEDLVSLARDRGVPFDAEMIGLLLEALDALRQAAERLARDHRDVDAALVASLVDRVVAAFHARGGSSRTAPTVEMRIFTPAPAQPPSLDGPPAASPPVVPPRERRDDSPREARTDFLRVDAAKVSALMDLAGELGLACSAVTRHSNTGGHGVADFAAAAHKLELLVCSIQNDLAALRLTPIGPLFQRLRRVVRDAAKKTHKEVALDVSGEDTEVDKVMLDAIQDPLVHALRNAIDHGIEGPDERAAAGKRPVGRVTVSATQQGGEITIEVRDDGRGLDRARIVSRARERGLCRIDAEPSEEEMAQFVFLPGFSIKDHADELSGRGVGMDVVKTTVEGLRGNVRLTSKRGQGSSLVMTMPLTLAFVEAMIVRESDRLFALPIEKVFEVSRVHGSRVVTNLADGQVLLRVRDECVPVVWLHRFWDETRTAATELDGRIVVVVQTMRGTVALPVDELIGNQQVMLKPMEGVLSRIRAATGCGLLRTGDVAIALDCDRLRA